MTTTNPSWSLLLIHFSSFMTCLLFPSFRWMTKTDPEHPKRDTERGIAQEKVSILIFSRRWRISQGSDSKHAQRRLHRLEWLLQFNRRKVDASLSSDSAHPDRTQPRNVQEDHGSKHLQDFQVCSQPADPRSRRLCFHHKQVPRVDSQQPPFAQTPQPEKLSKCNWLWNRQTVRSSSFPSWVGRISFSTRPHEAGWKRWLSFLGIPGSSRLSETDGRCLEVR